MSDSPAAPTPAAPGAPQAPAPVAPPAPPVAPPTPPASPAPSTPAAPAPAAPETQDVSTLPEWAQERLRNAEQPPAPAAPAPVPPETPAEGDVSRLPRWAQQAVSDGQGAARTLAMQTAVIAAAPLAGADISRLLDSTSAMRALGAVDPSDPAAVTAAIQAAVTAQPHLAAGTFQPGPGRGGVEFGNPASTEVTPQQFAQMDYAARAELYESDPATYRRLAG
ncbi:hypothetical protein ACH4JZ_18365 [Streptomyces sp. NPDC017615]|uniref:hypothetical protein n=1 Tax=Streptomyces sp. NPDC017615 TaxID=3365003 RepID=UPI0037A86CD8